MDPPLTHICADLTKKQLCFHFHALFNTTPSRTTKVQIHIRRQRQLDNIQNINNKSRLLHLIFNQSSCFHFVARIRSGLRFPRPRKIVPRIPTHSTHLSRWKPWDIMMPNLSSLTKPEVVVIMTTHGFQCSLYQNGGDLAEDNFNNI